MLIAGDRERHVQLGSSSTMPWADPMGVRVVVELAVSDDELRAEAWFVRDAGYGEEPLTTCAQIWRHDAHLRSVCEGAAGTDAPGRVGIGTTGSCALGDIEEAAAMLRDLGAWRELEVLAVGPVRAGRIGEVLRAVERLGIDARVQAGQAPACEGPWVADARALDEAAARAVGAGALVDPGRFTQRSLSLRSCATSQDCLALVPRDPTWDAPDCPDVQLGVSAEELAASPREDADAEWLALALDGRLVATETTVRRVSADLAAIRASHPELLHAHPATVEELRVVLDPRARAALFAGRWPGEACDARLPLDIEASAHPWASPRFPFRRSPGADARGRFDAAKLAQLLEGIPGVVDASPSWASPDSAAVDATGLAATWGDGGQILYAAHVGPEVVGFLSDPGRRPREVGVWRESEPPPVWAERFAAHVPPVAPGPLRPGCLVARVGLGPGADGVVAPEQVRQVIRRHSGQLKYCYGERLALSPMLAGRVELAWTLDRGHAQSVRVLADTVGDPPLTQCMLARVARWPFDPGWTGETRATFELSAVMEHGSAGTGEGG